MNTVSLTYIYFFYGLAFFAMGLAVSLEVGRTSELQFARSLPWLAAFGLIHGGHEWLEMFDVMGDLPTNLPLEQIRLVALVVSFACLAAFGISLSTSTELPRFTAMWRTLVLLGVCFAGMGLLRFWMTPSEWLTTASVWARYSLGVIGAILTSWALISHGRIFVRSGMGHSGRDLVWAAVAFALYGIVGQMFVTATRLPPSNIINSDLFQRVFGVPVQLFRGAMATVVAVTIIRALRVFETERSQQLQTAQAAAWEAERRAQRETAQLNRQLQEAVTELSILFEISRIVSATLDFQALLDQTVIKVVDLLPARAAMILLGESPEPDTVASTGFEGDENVPGMQAARTTGVQVIQSAQAGHPNVMISDHIIAIPLQAKDACIGSLAVCVSDATAFESRRSLLVTLGRELGIAIENARLYRQGQERQVLQGDLLRRSVEVQEEERKRIARELHDGIGQMFTALALGLSGVEETMARDVAMARQQVGNLKELSIRAITEMRQLVADLRPPQLDDLGLVPALHWLADEWRNRLHMDVRVKVTGHRRRLTPEIETVLFRIAQEGLTNIAKHAHAQHALIKLAFDTDPLELCIEDDGVGMTPEQAHRRFTRHQGWGLSGIQERAALVGGAVNIDSAPGRGTRLTVHISLAEQEATS